MTAMLRFEGVGKSFLMHAQGGVRLPVFDGVSFAVEAGECVALTGPSGIGKSSLLRMAYGNYRCPQGRLLVRDGAGVVDVAVASPRQILAMRRRTIGYVSQFLRVIPRVPTLDIVCEPLLALGHSRDDAVTRAGALLTRLRIPEALWSLSPVTFSGGEQQRVNLAHGLAAGYPVLLLDEPTASLDAANRVTVCNLIREAVANNTAVLGIFHDEAVRRVVATRQFDLAEAARAA